MPQLNVEQVCEGIAKQGGVTFRDPAIEQEKKNCLQSEQSIRDELVKQWSSFSPADRTSCVNEARMGGKSSYTELITCLEMARDVRAMHEQQQEGAPPPTSRRRAALGRATNAFRPCDICEAGTPAGDQ